MTSSFIQYLTPALFASIITLFLKWCLDLVTEKHRFSREKQKIVLQHQLEVMESAMSGYSEYGEALYTLKSVMERFSTNPSPAQVELLQRAMTNVTRLSEKNTGNTRSIMLYYNLSFLVKDYELEKIDQIFLDLSDIISNTNVRIAQLRSQNASPELLLVEYEHVAESYHLYAQAIDGKLNSIYALQTFLRTELQKMR